MKTLPDNQFNLGNEKSYQLWRERKLSAYPMAIDQLIVEIDNPFHLTAAEKQQMYSLLEKTNMLLYNIKASNKSDDFEQNKKMLKKLAQQFNLSNLDHNECADNDAITAIQINKQGLHKYYIPYSNKAINWHTDGYYNSLDDQVYSLLLHCVFPAERGGENKLLDPEIVYILLRDQNPMYIKALMDPDAMMIPENVIDNKLIRPNRSGPVFMFDESNYLHMRYSARKRNVKWKNDEMVIKAEAALRQIMQNDVDYHFQGKLQSGQGLLCRNVLHTRGQFDDPDQSNRLLFRGRYLDKLI